MPKVIQIVEDDVKALITDIKDGFEGLLSEIRAIGGNHVPTVNKLAQPLTAKLEALHQTTATADTAPTSATAGAPLTPAAPAPTPEPAPTPQPETNPTAAPTPEA